MATNADRQSTTEAAVRPLEHVDIYFFYRPKVDEDVATGFADVQRFYMILSPRGKASYRLIVIGQKRLPPPGRQRGSKGLGLRREDLQPARGSGG